jgi:hypothetical protein
MTDLSPGDTLRCDEAEDPDAEPTPTPLWEAYPRFRAVVDAVHGDYVEATATIGNSHPRTPDFGASLALSKRKIDSESKWSVVE